MHRPFKIPLTYLFLLAIFGFEVTPVAFATDCNEDCHERCRKCVSYDLGFVKDEKCVIEPNCHLQCEGEKKTSCAIGAPVPQLPTLSGDPRDIWNQNCKQPFDSFTYSTIAYCANWGGRANDLFLIEDAKQALIRLGLVNPTEFAGVDIRWCPLNGNGMTPEDHRILLHPNLKNDKNMLISTLGHEMQHIRQYARWGGNDFKCRYSQELVAGRGQGRGNYVEREAYEFEDVVKAKLAEIFVSPGTSQPPQNVYQTGPLSGRCGTPLGTCLMNNMFPVGSSCWCPSWQGPVTGQVF